eukprot:TRINITY_DN3742_c0_g1_i1.p1 TRINITY_DN3742_c0_g1~~TRINITY_DN3742_c0_g1_i1.p1  ORF type:complete len:358 (-),score=63.49 TRINITY_DN3742_c0_g1_i1:339-1412(-)
MCIRDRTGCMYCCQQTGFAPVLRNSCIPLIPSVAAQNCNTPGIIAASGGSTICGLATSAPTSAPTSAGGSGSSGSGGSGSGSRDSTNCDDNVPAWAWVALAVAVVSTLVCCVLAGYICLFKSRRAKQRPGSRTTEEMVDSVVISGNPAALEMGALNRKSRSVHELTTQELGTQDIFWITIPKQYKPGQIQQVEILGSSYRAKIPYGGHLVEPGKEFAFNIRTHESFAAVTVPEDWVHGPDLDVIIEGRVHAVEIPEYVEAGGTVLWDPPEPPRAPGTLKQDPYEAAIQVTIPQGVKPGEALGLDGMHSVVVPDGLKPGDTFGTALESPSEGGEPSTEGAAKQVQTTCKADVEPTVDI